MTSASIALSNSVSHSSIRNSALNNSISKMQYTFSKSRRFASEKKLSTDALFYDSPNVMDMRATNFGLGKKLTFQDKRVIPSANAYLSQSQFDSNINKKKGFTFGTSRQKLDIQHLQQSKVPGPGAYDPIHTSPNTSSKIAGRVRDNSLDEKIKVPGPGRYNLPALIGLNKIIESSKVNPRLPVISLERRQKVQKFQTPSPFDYNPQTPRKNSNSLSRSGKFSMTKRGELYKINHTPGPGFYNQFSEFS